MEWRGSSPGPEVFVNNCTIQSVSFRFVRVFGGAPAGFVRYGVSVQGISLAWGSQRIFSEPLAAATAGSSATESPAASGIAGVVVPAGLERDACRRAQRRGVEVVEAQAGRRSDIPDPGGLQPHRPGRHQWVALDRLVVDERVPR